MSPDHKTGASMPQREPQSHNFPQLGDRTQDWPECKGKEMTFPAEIKQKPSGNFIAVELPNSPEDLLPRPVMGPAEVERPNGPEALSPAADGSHLVTRGKKELVSRGSLDGLSLGRCAPPLLQKILEVFPLRSKYLGKGDKTALYPLPTSSDVYAALDPTLDQVMCSWMMCICVSLNSLWGDDLYNDKLRNEGQKACLLTMVKDVRRICSIPGTVSVADWNEVMKTKSVDYKGDEVKVARWFEWGNIAPALPAEIGRVPLADVCERGCREYVLHFDDYLKPKDQWISFKPPRVMVPDGAWGRVCQGLVEHRVCTFLREEDVFQTPSGALLNGLFGVSKEEWTHDGTEIFRLIMNLIPLNGLCRGLSGDVDTLPAWSSMNPFFLQPTECLLVSSEDIRCFFYTMSVPPTWVKYLAFNKPVPQEVVPTSMKGETVYLASVVLPMGFLNSVSLAQHVHRTLVSRSSLHDDFGGCNPPQEEIRKDRPLPSSNNTWRVYLDNYDLLEKVKATSMIADEGTCPPGVLALRHEYEQWGIPRNVKKAVERSTRCELQGATVDGQLGLAFPREGKLLKYFQLAFSLCSLDRACQKQWQIACGGLVYFSMFRRPMLGSLNRVWQHIEAFNTPGPVYRATPEECKVEILRFLGMLPLVRMDFRLDMHAMVTCSDASTTGGGICQSIGLTEAGAMVAEGGLRGDIPEARGDFTVLSIGLFDGIAALRVALDLVGVQVLGHVSVESNPHAQRVVEAHFPGTICVSSVQEVTEEMVLSWSCRFSQCALVLLGAGPPCQGVSGLNFDRKGALRDERSSLFHHVPRIRTLLRKHFRWCPVHSIMESVLSMDIADRDIMTESIGDEPIACDAGCFTLCHRPRIYWLSWDVVEAEGISVDRSKDLVTVVFDGQQAFSDVLREGWTKVCLDMPFPTFTTSRPRSKAGRKPAGIGQCTLAEVQRWVADDHRYPPYQYKDVHCLKNARGELRLPDIAEREAMLGFPVGYTMPCVSKQQRKTMEQMDIRKTLLGNTWSVPVVAVLLGQLFSLLGWISPLHPEQVLARCRPGGHSLAQGRLARLPLNPCRRKVEADPAALATKLGNLVSIKGEDILLTTPTSQLVKFHRLRASVPARLWRWQIVSGWKWSHPGDHINTLELRAVLTSLRYRIEHRRQLGCRMIHLVDSLVCLHALARGRSSSRRLRRTLARVNALILAGNVQPVWSYVHTDTNPADKPSRWGRRVKTKFRHGPKTSA
eukprot:Skav236156  [mRNA]  locus=scaffold436:191685:195386:- [translate_table: standard]